MGCSNDVKSGWLYQEPLKSHPWPTIWDKTTIQPIMAHHSVIDHDHDYSSSAMIIHCWVLSLILTTVLLRFLIFSQDVLQGRHCLQSLHRSDRPQHQRLEGHRIMEHVIRHHGSATHSAFICVLHVYAHPHACMHICKCIIYLFMHVCMCLVSKCIGMGASSFNVQRHYPYWQQGIFWEFLRYSE